jgi:pimeloyl-ACP methyl ester carboxylesterase
MRQGRWSLLLLVLALCGCTTFMARQIERPGHDNKAQLAPFRRMLDEAGFRHEEMRTRQGVRIAYRTAQPRSYKVDAQVEERRDAVKRRFAISVHYDLELDPKKTAPLPARGSIVLLHPWGTEGSAMTIWALLFASAGYVVVVPDLRSHGESADAPAGYGPREADDIADLVHDLRAANRLPGPLYLLGVSYGGTVALFAAPKLADVHGVIALEPYANAAAVIRRAPASGLFGYRWLASWIRPREMDDAIQRASQQLGVDLAQIDPGNALAHTPSCALIVRGADDNLIARSALRELARRSPRAGYVEVPQEGHLNLPLRTDRLFQPLLDWMQALPVDTSSACPGFTPGPFVMKPPANPVPVSLL